MNVEDNPDKGKFRVYDHSKESHPGPFGEDIRYRHTDIFTQAPLWAKAEVNRPDDMIIIEDGIQDPQFSLKVERRNEHKYTDYPNITVTYAKGLSQVLGFSIEAEEGEYTEVPEFETRKEALDYLLNILKENHSKFPNEPNYTPLAFRDLVRKEGLPVDVMFGFSRRIETILDGYQHHFGYSPQDIELLKRSGLQYNFVLDTLQTQQAGKEPVAEETLMNSIKRTIEWHMEIVYIQGLLSVDEITAKSFRLSELSKEGRTPDVLSQQTRSWGETILTQGNRLQIERDSQTDLIVVRYHPNPYISNRPPWNCTVDEKPDSRMLKLLHDPEADFRKIGHLIKTSFEMKPEFGQPPL